MVHEGRASGGACSRGHVWAEVFILKFLFPTRTAFLSHWHSVHCEALLQLTQMSGRAQRSQGSVEVHVSLCLMKCCYIRAKEQRACWPQITKCLFIYVATIYKMSAFCGMKPVLCLVC